MKASPVKITLYFKLIIFKTFQNSIFLPISTFPIDGFI